MVVDTELTRRREECTYAVFLIYSLGAVEFNTIDRNYRSATTAEEWAAWRRAPSASAVAAVLQVAGASAPPRRERQTRLETRALGAVQVAGASAPPRSGRHGHSAQSLCASRAAWAAALNMSQRPAF